jgi:hypothetical protein
MAQSESQSPRNAAQLSAIQSHYESQVRKVIDSLNLRKWLVEKFGDKLKINELESLHAFITHPSTEGIAPPRMSLNEQGALD